MDWFEAAERGNAAYITELLAQGADVDARSKLGGRTALSLASASGHLAVMDVCLRNNANPNLSDAAGVTALMLAAHNDRHEAVSMLLAAGANPLARDNADQDVLWYATHREINFVLAYPRASHGTLFVRRLFPTRSVRLIRMAISHSRRSS
jgi:ankyrin repeat protein